MSEVRAIERFAEAYPDVRLVAARLRLSRAVAQLEQGNLVQAEAAARGAAESIRCAQDHVHASASDQDRKDVR